MPIKPVTYYTAECDHCGADLLADDEFSAYSAPDHIEDIIRESEGGKVWGDEIVCSGCIYPYWSKLDGDDWDDLYDDKPEAVAKFKAWLADNPKEKAA